MFFGRQKELELLEKAFASDRSELIVLYGRRRVGKTSLVQQFLKGKKAFHFEALEGERTPAQIRHFAGKLKKQFADPLLESLDLSSWESVFQYLTQKIILPGEKIVLFFDELQWMAAGQSRLVSLIKYYWDNEWKNRNLKLILCGSIASFMVKKVVQSKALYGRLTMEILLKSLRPHEAFSMFRGKRSLEEVLLYLMIFGGIPKYLEEIDLNASFSQNINRLCFDPSGYLFQEFKKIFYSQFRETQTYLKIVRRLKEKMSSLEELSKSLKTSSGGGLKHYIVNLEEAEIIKSFIPFGKKESTKLKKYKLFDEYLVFYFKYMEPYSRTIKEKLSKNIFKTIRENSWESWLGNAFERFCLKNMATLAEVMGFSEELVSAAPYFERGDHHFQIDLLFQRTDRIITLCEIKYHNKPIGTLVIPEVERKCKLFPLPRGYTLEKALISTYGPDQALKESGYFHHCVQLEQFFFPT